jgi:hypothetical protein
MFDDLIDYLSHVSLLMSLGGLIVAGLSCCHEGQYLVGRQKKHATLSQPARPEGALVGMAPAGTWMWMSLFPNSAASIPKDPARFLTMLSAAWALPHHLAELPGEDQLAAPWSAGRFDEQNVAVVWCPGEAGRYAGHARTHRQLGIILGFWTLAGEAGELIFSQGLHLNRMRFSIPR